VSTRLYSNDELGLRFVIDDSFADGPPLVASPELPGNVRSAYLAARDAGGGQAVLSISRVEVGYDTSPQELAEQLVIHNRYAAHTAEQQGWTIHSPWKATMLAGYPAMRCDYVVPQPAASPAAAGGDSTPGHVQAWVAYVGGDTLQLMLGVDPPGDLTENRRRMEQAMRSLELFEPAG
jgi:hypothetical protein